MTATVSLADTINEDEVISLYRANGWSSAEKPKLLLAALKNPHSLVTSRIGGRLVGIGNAISDGHLVVYFPHLLVHPDVQRKGIGRQMMMLLLDKYSDFHQLMLTADGDAINFFKSLGFSRAGKTESMWIYGGADH